MHKPLRIFAQQEYWKPRYFLVYQVLVVVDSLIDIYRKNEWLSKSHHFFSIYYFSRNNSKPFGWCYRNDTFNLSPKDVGNRALKLLLIKMEKSNLKREFVVSPKRERRSAIVTLIWSKYLKWFHIHKHYYYCMSTLMVLITKWNIM